MQNQFRNSVPQGGHAITADKPKPEWLKVLQGIALMPLMLGGYALFGQVGGAMEGPPEDPKFKCLNEWNGSMFDFEWELKQSLRDPDSFELINSYASPVKADGLQRIRFEYRARNGFGGMNVEMASAVISNADCKLISWSHLS